MFNFFAGIIVIGVGVFFNFKTEWMLNNFGRIQFFEEKMGLEGGSRIGYKLIGLVIIFIGILLVTGLFNGFMEGMLSPLTRFNQ